MIPRFDPYLEHIRGNTWCIVTGFCRIPLYMQDRSDAVMIDSGLKRVDREGILALLEREKIHVSSLLTSHYHQDHVGNHAAIRSVHGSTVYATPYAASICSDPDNLRSGGYETYISAKSHSGYENCPTDQLIDWNAPTLTVSGAEFGLLQLPGHAQEQLGFVTPDGVVYLSDTLLSEHILNGMRLPYYTYLKQDLEAKEALRQLHQDCFILAHNGVYSDISALIDRNIAAVHEQLDMVERLADHWQTQEQLTVAIMKELNLDLTIAPKIFGAKRNTQVLMEYLLEFGRLKFRVRDGYVEYISAKM